MTHEQKVTKFEELIADFRDGTLITHNLGNQLRGRPMYILKRDNEENLWMATGADSEKAREIKKDNRVFQQSSEYISVSGTVSLETDKSLIDELWNEGLRIYFPEGPNDPHLALLKFTSIWAEYWDMSGVGKKLQYAFESGKSYLQGEKIDPEKISEHEKVGLKLQPGTKETF